MNNYCIIKISFNIKIFLEVARKYNDYGSCHLSSESNLRHFNRW